MHEEHEVTDPQIVAALADAIALREEVRVHLRRPDRTVETVWLVPLRLDAGDEEAGPMLVTRPRGSGRKDAPALYPLRKIAAVQRTSA